jgi:RNA polymerase sigma-70 factor (ECF subfamily)
MMAGLDAERRQPTAGEALVGSLFHEHRLGLVNYATRLTGDRGIAEDVVQEALFRAWHHADNLLTREGSIHGWLLTVVRNLVTDQARARKARPAEVMQPPVEVAVEHDHADLVVASVLVAEALGSLGRPHREVVEHLYLLGNTVNDTAKILSIPPGTVKSRAFYALRVLRQIFSERDPAPGPHAIAA